MVVAARAVQIQISSGITFNQSFAASTNNTANGAQEVKDLTAGFNAFAISTAGSTIPTAVTIIPPAGNTQTMTLKGVTGDTGISLHKEDPTSIALSTTATTFGITAGGTIAGIRLIYT